MNISKHVTPVGIKFNVMQPKGIASMDLPTEMCSLASLLGRTTDLLTSCPYSYATNVPS